MARFAVLQRTHISKLFIVTLTMALTGCYDYRPLDANGSVTPQTASPSGTTSASVPTPSPSRQQLNEKQQGPSTEESEAAEKAALAAKNCADRFPESPGQKTQLVRCIVSSTDEIWDRAFPEGAEERHALGSYAIQLAQREDRGEISKEQAENLYMQFLQQTPSLGIPPKGTH